MNPAPLLTTPPFTTREEPMPEWLRRIIPQGWTGWERFLLSAGLFVVMLVGSLIITAIILVRLPADYFVGDHPRRLWVDRHPVIRWTLVGLKNLLGLVVVAIGVVLSLPGVPGQGILAILMGLLLIEFPGRRQLGRGVLTRRGVLNAVNKLRARYGRPPMYLHSEPES